jgi:hypothetical protein
MSVSRARSRYKSSSRPRLGLPSLAAITWNRSGSSSSLRCSKARLTLSVATASSTPLTRHTTFLTTCGDRVASPYRRCDPREPVAPVKTYQARIQRPKLERNRCDGTHNRLAAVLSVGCRSLPLSTIPARLREVAILANQFMHEVNIVFGCVLPMLLPCPESGAERCKSVGHPVAMSASSACCGMAGLTVQQSSSRRPRLEADWSFRYQVSVELDVKPQSRRSGRCRLDALEP